VDSIWVIRIQETVLSIETEVKIRIVDFAQLRCSMAKCEPVRISPRHFEDNYIFDFADGRIKEQHSLVRLRMADGKALLTYKGAAEPQGLFKSREELETGLEDPSMARAILERLGLKVNFRYQKYREEFRILVPGSRLDEVRLALDETPVGDYAEFEGSETAIRAVTAAMGLDESQFLRASYCALYLQFCCERGETPGNMIFLEKDDRK
jgi:predicted adenylyl cyclase CyaB